MFATAVLLSAGGRPPFAIARGNAKVASNESTDEFVRGDRDSASGNQFIKSGGGNVVMVKIETPLRKLVAGCEFVQLFE